MSDRLRNIVICCDGTMNDSETNTNVKRLYDGILCWNSGTRKRPTQVRHYVKGVGSGVNEAVSGGALGIGIRERVLSCYGFLCDHFQQISPRFAHDENQIYLFGFSRGAYTARRIAGLLHHSGLPKSRNDLATGWKNYLAQDTKRAKALKKEKRFFDVKIKLVGVWDTVKATLDAKYHDKVLPPNVERGFHALAIDERRASFAPLRWNADAERVTEVWFPGVHSDVGGGYEQTSLSNIALRWMIFRAKEAGLKFNPTHVELARGRADGVLHNSLKGPWVWMGEHTRAIREKDWVHTSVRSRMNAKRLAKKYKPDNLPTTPRYWSPPPKAK